MVGSRLAAGRTAGLICALALLGCGASEDPEAGAGPGPEQIGPSTYGLASGGPCWEPCWSWKLYRDGDLLELRAFDERADDAFVGRAQADLSPETAAQLDALSEELLAVLEEVGVEGLGAPPDPTCDTFDHDAFVELPLGEQTLDYLSRCVPAEAEALDALLWQLMDDLMRCRPTQRLSPKIGCEELDPWADLYGAR